MALTDKIKQYAGDLTGLDSTYALRQAVDHTLAMAKQVSPIQYQAFVNKIPTVYKRGTNYTFVCWFKS